MVFAVEAPRYWEQGISVIPVSGKRPVLGDWSRWALELPDAETQRAWLENFSGPDYGIGLVCGPVSGIMAVDIDTDDPKTIALIERVLPFSPWHRVGRRGKIMVYKFRDPKNFSIKQGKGVEAKSLIDVLASKKQFILPPSIHPDTGKPYYANCDLLSVIKDLREAPEKLDQVLRGALESEGVDCSSTRGEMITATRYVAAGARDHTMLKLCGLYSKEIIDGKWNLMQQVQNLVVWVDSQVEKVWGDELDASKAIDRLVYCLKRDVFEQGKTLPVGWDEGLTEDLRVEWGLSDLGEIHRRWSYKEISDWFDNQIAQEGVLGDAGRMHEVVSKTLERMAANPDLEITQIDCLFKHVNSVTAGAYRIVALRQQLATMKRGERSGDTHADAAEIILEIVEREGEVRFADGRFWQWIGSHWNELDDAMLEKLVIDNSQSMSSTKKSNDYSGVLKTMRGLKHKALRENTLHGVNFVNGYLTRDLVLVPHDPDYGCTYVLPYPYKPELADKCHLWEHMLHTYWGKDEDYREKVMGLQEAMAATIFGVATEYDMAFCLYGVRFAGKTQVINVMKGLMPPGTHCSVPPEKFSEKFESTELAGKLMNYAGELSGRHPINGKIFKIIVEGSQVQGQFKNKPVFAYKPIAAHWFGSNHVPRVDEMDGGFARRWLFFTFDHPLDPKDAIPEVADRIIAEEAPAVMAWAVQGMARLVANRRYTLSKSHYEMKKDLELKGDSVLFWLGRLREQSRVRFGAAEHMTVTKKFTSVEELFRAYRLFCSSAASVQHVSLQIFVERMRQQSGEYPPELKFIPMRGATSGITGFSLITLVDAPAG